MLQSICNLFASYMPKIGQKFIKKACGGHKMEGINILYSADGGISLLQKKFSRSLPNCDFVCDCVKIAMSKGNNFTSKVVKMTQKDVKNDTAKCEPSRFLLYRDLSIWAKRACEDMIREGLISYEKAVLRLPEHASPTELLTSGILAKCCNIRHLILSMSGNGYTHEHSIAARLCGADEVILSDEAGCIHEAIGMGADLICGYDSDLFSVLAGAVSPYIDTRVHSAIKGKTFILSKSYEGTAFSEDLRRESLMTGCDRIVLISADPDRLMSYLPRNCEPCSYHVLITSSDEESFAAAMKLNSSIALSYGDFDRSKYPDIISAGDLPPLMREVVLPFSLSPIRPCDFLRIPRGAESQVGVMDFANALSRHVKLSLSEEDCSTFVSRISSAK